MEAVGNALYNAAAGPSRLVNAQMQEYQPGMTVGDMPQTMEQLPEVAMNAVGMPGGVGGLGSGVRLPMDHASRMTRAAEQGFTVDAYKGMNPYHPDSYPVTNGMGKIIEQPKRPMEELTSIDAAGAYPREGRGAGFFSNDPTVASRFAEALGSGPGVTGSVYPVKLKFENPKIIDAEGRFAADFQFGKGGNQLDLPPGSSHDGVILKNTKDEGDVFIPRNPDQIRSRWAAFDPANKDSGNLLGSLAGLFGLGAYMQNEQK